MIPSFAYTVNKKSVSFGKYIYAVKQCVELPDHPFLVLQESAVIL